MSAVDDHKLLDLGIGFTNIVPRTTRGLSDLSRKEIADGAEVRLFPTFQAILKFHHHSSLDYRACHVIQNFSITKSRTISPD